MERKYILDTLIWVAGVAELSLEFGVEGFKAVLMGLRVE
jgi:hypothetical protein